MNYQYFSFTFGFLVWLLATLIFRIWGQVFFLIDNPFIITAFFLGTIPTLFLLVKWVYNRYQLTGEAKLHSAVLMAIPGMLGDVVCIQFHAMVFPRLSMEQVIVLGSWVLWAYVIVLIIGALVGRKKLNG